MANTKKQDFFPDALLKLVLEYAGMPGLQKYLSKRHYWVAFLTKMSLTTFLAHAGASLFVAFDASLTHFLKRRFPNNATSYGRNMTTHYYNSRLLHCLESEWWDAAIATKNGPAIAWLCKISTEMDVAGPMFRLLRQIEPADLEKVAAWLPPDVALRVVKGE
jgi:hypothetical protein